MSEVTEFATRFSEFMQAMPAAAERPESELVERIREHLGAEPGELPSTAADFSITEHPNLQLALEAVLPDAEVLGYVSPHQGFGTIGLNELLALEAAGLPIHFPPA